MSDPITRLNAALQGRYRIESGIGEGGMATVYVADDLKHERRVALKVLKPELAAVVGADRFLAEIKTTANLQHPHILPLHDSGEADGFLYYVMPYIEGETLGARIERDSQLPVDEALSIATAVAHALQVAHEAGIVHRDIKPGNILLSRGEPLVADFGIALAVSAGGGGRLTETGLSLGTPYYMSPEQATGDQTVGPASDTFALACVLYEMLVGEPPYPGNTAQAVLGKIIQGVPVSATAIRQSVPAHVDAAIRKALEKLPADRFSSAQDFARALADPGFRHGATTADSAAVGASTWNRLTIAFATLAVLATGVATSTLLRPDPAPPIMRQILSADGWAGLDVEFGRYAAVAPDGSSMILPLDGGLALKMTGSAEITPIPGTEQARDVVYSPDGEWIAYAVGTDLYKRPVMGGSALRIAEDAEGGTNRLGLTWLDDGTILYEVPGPFRLVRIPDDGGDPLAVLEYEGTAFFWVHGLPDARGALAVTFGAELVVVDLRNQSWAPLLEQVLRAWYTPTGHLLYVRSDGALFAAPFDLETLTISGGATPILDRVRVTQNRADMRLGADGTLLYVEGASSATEGAFGLLLVDLEGIEEALPLSSRDFGEVAWSQDGRSVVYGSDGQIYTYDVAVGTTPRQLTFEGDNIRPVFSPDGLRVAFTSSRDGTDGGDLWMKTLDDDAPARSIISLPGNEYPTNWPSDTLIVFEQGPNPSDLWMLDLSDPADPTPTIYLPLEADLDDVVISKDGTLAAYGSNETGTDEVYIRSFPEPGERTPVSQGGGLYPFWSPDGNFVYYWSDPPSPRGVTFMAARIQREPTPVVLARDSLFTGSYFHAGSDLHPDGDRIVVPGYLSDGAEGEVADPARLLIVLNSFEELRERTSN